MSQLEKFEFKDFVSDEKYRRYFDTITSDKSVYICVILAEDQAKSVYLERPLQNAESVEGIIRVFFDIEDVNKYVKSVAFTEKIALDLVSGWEIKFSSLVKHAMRIDAQYKKAGKLGVRAVGSTVIGEKYKEIDTLWTSEPHLMV